MKLLCGYKSSALHAVRSRWNAKQWSPHLQGELHESKQTPESGFTSSNTSCCCYLVTSFLTPLHSGCIRIQWTYHLSLQQDFYKPVWAGDETFSLLVDWQELNFILSIHSFRKNAKQRQLLKCKDLLFFSMFDLELLVRRKSNLKMGAFLWAFFSIFFLTDFIYVYIVHLTLTLQKHPNTKDKQHNAVHIIFQFCTDCSISNRVQSVQS